jgi:hypothetical protein
MGGARETTVSSKATESDKKKKTIGDIRIHESNGEVHFHSDTSKLKVAIPVGVWFHDWANFIHHGGSYSYVDHERSTKLSIAFNCYDGVTDACISIEKIEMGDAFKSLQEFTFGKKNV